jgi:hypothetical protein
MTERAPHDVLLGRALRRKRDVLPLAPAAPAEDVARRRDAIGARRQEVDDLGPQIARRASPHPRADPIAGRRERQEDHLAVGARERIGSEGQALDGERQQGVVGHGGMVAGAPAGCKRAGRVLETRTSMGVRDEVRLRRGRRSDLARLQALLPSAPQRARFDRRTLASLAGDVYVAEDAGGAIVGVVSVAYLRSMTEGRFAAVLDAARAAADSLPLLDRLIAFAEARARRRGCRRLAAWIDPGDAALRAALESRGYGARDLLVAELGEAG